MSLLDFVRSTSTTRQNLHAGIVVAAADSPLHREPGLCLAFLAALSAYGAHPIDAQRSPSRWVWEILCWATPESDLFRPWREGELIQHYDAEIRSERVPAMAEHRAVTYMTPAEMLAAPFHTIERLRILRLIPVSSPSPYRDGMGRATVQEMDNYFRARSRWAAEQEEALTQSLFQAMERADPRPLTTRELDSLAKAMKPTKPAVQQHRLLIGEEDE